jgi:outer membrane lipopolysaccharide assembly protein LptE/RlpB
MRFLTILLTLILTSCGYTFQGSQTILPKDIKTVYIPVVKNRSIEPSLTGILTDSIKDRVGRFGVLQIVESENEADATLDVQILKVKRIMKTNNTRSDVSIEQDLKLLLSGELRRKNGAVLWRNPNLDVSKTFATSRQSVLTSSSDFANSTLGASDISNFSEREVARGQAQDSLINLCDNAAKAIYLEAIAPDF